MSEAPQQDQGGPNVQGSAEKDPSDWVTGDEPMTGPQKSYLDTLAQQAGVDVPDDLIRARRLRRSMSCSGRPVGGPAKAYR